MVAELFVVSEAAVTEVLSEELQDACVQCLRPLVPTGEVPVPVLDVRVVAELFALPPPFPEEATAEA